MRIAGSYRPSGLCRDVCSFEDLSPRVIVVPKLTFGDTVLQLVVRVKLRDLRPR